MTDFSDSKKIYIMMNKPCGVVCSAVSDSHKTVFQFLPEELQSLLKSKRGSRLHTAGRLDSETSGLILITNDGEFSHGLTAPENKIPKIYHADLKFSVPRELQEKYIADFAKGLILPPEKKYGAQQALPCSLIFLSETECEVTVTEGKFHEVRRLFLAEGNEVLKLKRLSFGPYVLPQNLAEGSYIFLTNGTEEN